MNTTISTNENTQEVTKKDTKPIFKKKAPKKSSLPKVIWSYMLSGLVIKGKGETKEVTEVLENTKELLKSLNLEQVGFLTWKGKTSLPQENQTLQTSVKVWKIEDRLWTSEVYQLIFDGKTGKNIKRYTCGSGSLTANVIFLEAVLGVNNLKAIMPGWSYGKDVLSLGKTKFELQAEKEEGFIEKIKDDFGVISPNRSEFLTRQEFLKREERLRKAPSKIIAKATSNPNPLDLEDDTLESNSAQDTQGE